MKTTIDDIATYCKKTYNTVNRDFSIRDYGDGVYANIPVDGGTFPLNLGRLRDSFKDVSFWREDEGNRVYFEFNR